MGTASTTTLALLLTGCPAEQLGVPLPPRGEAAITQDDVQRDLYLLTPGEWNLVDPGDALTHRLAEVGLVPAFEGSFTRGDGAGRATCGWHEGDAGPFLMVLAQAEGPGTSQSTLRAAEIISLAKSVDRLELRQAVLFCYLGAEAGPAFEAEPPRSWSEVGGLVAVGSLAAPGVAIAEAPFLGRPARWAVGGPDPLAGTEADGIERLDYRVIEGHLRAIHRDVLAGLLRDPPPASPPPPPH